MPFDRLLIAPLNAGLRTDSPRYASPSTLNVKTLGRIMSLRKTRKDIKDIAGKRFNDLTVLYMIGKGLYRGTLWQCKCDCGNECSAYGGHLRSGKRKSCGCRSEARIFETGINRVYGSYKRKAKSRNLEFSIKRNDFEKLVTSNCFYCGSEPFNELKRLKTKKLQIKYNGIDRFDPVVGYTQSNCVPCCYYCNHAKLDLSFDQWKSHLKRIFKFQEITSGI